MADNEKVLNTRIINKHALLSDWNSSSLTLKDGEIALARIELANNNSTSGENNNISTTPAYIIKVGTGDANFNGSAWAYAKAIDVYSWAKQANLPVECGDDTTAEDYVAGNVISSITFDNGKIKYNTATVATSEGFEALTERIIAIEGYLELSQDEEGNTVVGLVDRVSALETLVGNTSVNEQINSAIETLIGDDNTITDLTTLKSDLKTAIQGDTSTTVYEVERELDNLVDEIIPQLHSELQGETSSTIANVEAQVSDLAGDGRTNETVKGNADAIAEINTWISGNEPGNGAENRIEGLETIVHGTEDNPGGLILAANNATEHIADTSNPHNVTAAQVGLGNVENKSTATIKAEFTGAIVDGNTGFVTGDAVYDVKATANAAKARIDAFIDGTAEADSAIDTLVEIQQFMTDDTGAFVALSNKVTNIENGTTTIPKADDANTVDGLHAQELKDYADTASSNAVQSFSDAIEQRKYANEDYVNACVSNAIQNLDVTDITGMGAGKTIATLTETDGKIEAEFQDIAITKSQITDFDHNHDDKYQKLVPNAGVGHYAVFGNNGQIEDGGELYFSTDIRTTQEAESLENASASLGFSIYDRYDSNESDSGKIFAEFHIDIPDQGGLAVIQPEYEISGDNDDSVVAGGNLVIKEKGVTTDKIADHAVGAAQIKAEQSYTGTDAEVWVFDCGGAE